MNTIPVAFLLHTYDLGISFRNVSIKSTREKKV